MPVRVLVADDEPAILQTLSAVLRLEDVEVATAASAGDAVEQMRSRDFDLIITDMRMETANAGLKVIHAAASHRCRPVIIVLTAYPLSRADMMQSAKCNVMLKGSDPNMLIHELRSVVALIKTGKARESE